MRGSQVSVSPGRIRMGTSGLLLGKSRSGDVAAVQETWQRYFGAGIYVFKAYERLLWR